jgi:hypothetical protein
MHASPSYQPLPPGEGGTAPRCIPRVLVVYALHAHHPPLIALPTLPRTHPWMRWHRRQTPFQGLAVGPRRTERHYCTPPPPIPPTPPHPTPPHPTPPHVQNIDSLEHLAGLPKERVVAAHGNFDSASCVDCGEGHAVEEVKKKILGGEAHRCNREVGLWDVWERGNGRERGLRGILFTFFTGFLQHSAVHLPSKRTQSPHPPCASLSPPGLRWPCQA